MIIAGKPNKGVEDESRSDVTGAGGPEGEVKVWFEDTTCVNMTDFLNTQLQFFFQTRRQDYKLLPKRRDLIGWSTTGRHARWAIVRMSDSFTTPIITALALVLSPI